MKFRESKLAHQYCVGTGLEIGGSAHNPFGLNTKNVDFTKKLTSFKREEIRLCGEYRPVDIEAAGDNIPLSDESQDFIVSSHVLEHFIDPLKALLEWYRLVKYGGIMFMIVPHKERTFDKIRQRTKLQELIDRHDGKIKLDETSHEHYSVWITEDVVELIGYMNRSGLFPNPVSIEAVQDIDDKVGNGFAIVLRKLPCRITEFSRHSQLNSHAIIKIEGINNQDLRSESKLRIGILTIDAYDTACPYIRLRSPLSDLQRKGMIELVQICELKDGNLRIDFNAIKKLDILIIQRQFPGVLPYSKLIKLLGKDKPKIVFEIDDAFHLVPTTHMDYSYLRSINSSLEEYTQKADLITVSTDYLKRSFLEINRNIVTLPNLLDIQIWSGSRERIGSGIPVKVLFSGTVTHAADIRIIEKAIEKILVEFGERIQFLFWGSKSQSLQHYSQVKEFGPFLSNYLEYAEQLKHADVDFAVIPLEDNPFNKAKSAVKWIEYSACGIPGIYSNISAYNTIIENGKTGILVNNSIDEWYSAIKKFIIDSSYRQEIAQNAKTAVLLNHTVESHSVKWLCAYQSLFAPVSIIIPVFNKVEYTRQCIEALKRNLPVSNHEIIIIDNGSTDGTGDYLKSLEEPFKKVITNPFNLGFAKACNQGAKAAAFDYLLFLNNDTEPIGNWIGPLTKILDNDPMVGAVGSKLLFPDGKIQHAGVLIFDDRKLPDPLVARHIHYNLDSDTPDANEPRLYQALTAACFLIRKGAFDQVGGFDEGYWNGYEDIDLCFKLQEKKWLLVYQPQSGLIHHESKSGPERFTKVEENIGRLHSRWIGKIKPDAIISEDGSLTWSEANKVRNYSENPCVPEKHPIGLPKIQSKTVSIIILTFNQLRYTKECLESIRQCTPELHEIIFVDNGSTDNTIKWLRKTVANNLHYRLIENSENLGFSKGCNQGIAASTGQYILLLNNDVVVTENWLSGMIECLNHGPGIGIVGPMTNNVSGPQKVPSVSYSAIDELNEYSRAFRTNNRHRRIHKRRVVGFCMLFRRQLVEEIGFLDESFGSGNFEDDDFCLRAVLSGYRNMIAGDVFIHHYGSKTFIGNGIDYGSSLSGNRRIFIEKWGEEALAQRFGRKLVVENAVVKADELFDKGDIEKATACILGALKQAPHERSLYFKIAEMLIDMKRYQDAVGILDALHQNDSDPMPPALIGYCEEALGNNEKAREYAERALAIDPRAALPMNVNGVLSFKKGEHDVAENSFKRAIESAPSFGESYTNLGSLKWAAGKTEEAMKLFERGFILSPTVNDVATAYHTAVVEMKSFENAETVIREARALHPNHKRITFLLIALLLQLEKHESAMQEIEKAMIQFGIDDGILSAGLEIRKRIGALKIDKSNRRKATLSLCMIVKNEEPHLAKCLMSVKPVVDEMIVVDTGSNDRTKSIAAALGATVFDHPWTNDFSEARNYSLSKASGDWILVLDADEAVSPLDYGVLKKIAKKHPAKRVAYSMVTRNYTNNPGAGGWVANEGRYAEEEAGKGWVSSSKVRLFVNDKRIQFVNPVHELVEPALSKLGIQIKACDVPVHHYGRLDQKKVISKGKEYYRLGIAKIEQTKGDYNALRELAIQASEIGEYEEAVKVWRKVIELQPNDAAAHMNMGFAFLMMRQYDSAIQFSKIAMQLDPELREAALNYSGAEMIAGDIHTAVTTLEHIMEKHADYPPAMGRLAAAYIVSGRKEEGLRYLGKLNSRGFDCASVLEEQALAFMAESKLEAAVSLLIAAVEKGIGNGSMNDLLAECRSKIDCPAPIGNPIDFPNNLQRRSSEQNDNSVAL